MISTSHPIAELIFKRLAPKATLSVIDAGASGGGEANRWAFLGEHLRLYGFEADDDECARLKQSAAERGVKAEYFNTFLGRNEKK
jgi:precorrin-6B methylase 2